MEQYTKIVPSRRQMRRVGSHLQAKINIAQQHAPTHLKEVHVVGTITHQPINIGTFPQIGHYEGSEG